jgi:hypothetical protein
LTMGGLRCTPSSNCWWSLKDANEYIKTSDRECHERRLWARWQMCYLLLRIWEMQ